MKYLKTYEKTILSNSTMREYSNNIKLIKNIDINSTTYQGRTLLMNTYSLEITKYLINNGVDLDKKDDNGSTALIYHAYQALNYDNLGIVKELIKAGANWCVIDNDGDNFFDLLSRKMKMKIKKKFPKQYQKYLEWQETIKYNI